MSDVGDAGHRDARSEYRDGEKGYSLEWLDVHHVVALRPNCALSNWTDMKN